MRWATPLVICLALGGGALAQTTTEPSTAANSPPANVSSSGQTGGVTAGQVGVVNQTTIGSDSQLDSLKSLLTAHSQRAREGSAKLRDLPAYLFLIDARDPKLMGPGGLLQMYFLFVGPTWIIETQYDGELCHPQDDIALYGLSVFGTEKAGSRTLTMKFLTVSDPVFGRICETLGEPVDSARRASRSDLRTRYDDLSLGGIDVTQLVLLPSEIDGVPFASGYQRHFWAGAFTSFAPMGLASLPPDFQQFVTDYPAGEEFSFDLPPGQSEQHKPTPTAPYPPAIAAELGGRLTAMDDKWVAYLARKAGKGKPVPVFTSGQIGSSNFWRSSNSLKDFFFDTSCAGSAFLLENSYGDGPGAQQSSACMFGRASTNSGAGG